MFFRKKKPDPEKMDAIAGAVGIYIKMSLAVMETKKLREIDHSVIDAFIFGAVDYMAQSSKMGDSETVSKITGLVLTKHLGENLDAAWERVISMASMSSTKAGLEVMRLGGKSFREFAKTQDPKTALVLKDLIEGDYFA